MGKSDGKVEGFYKAPEQLDKSEDIIPITHLQIEPTTRCNFSCKFCCGRSMKKGDLKYGLFEKIIDQFQDVTYIELHGEGEPMLNPQFFEMAALAKSRGIKLSYITNGSHFTPEAVNKILDLPFEKITISMESTYENKFRDIRGGSLNKVIQGIELLVQERNKRGQSRPAVGLTVTVLKDTKRELLKIADLYNRLELDGGIYIQPLQKTSCYLNGYSEDIKNQILSEKEEIELFLLTSSNSKTLSYQQYRKINENRSRIPFFYDELFKDFYFNQRRCPYLDRSVYINFEGFVTACCLIKDTENFSLGKIEEDSYESINTKRYEMIQQLRNGSIPEACIECRIVQSKMKRGLLSSLSIYFKVLINRLYKDKMKRGLKQWTL